MTLSEYSTLFNIDNIAAVDGQTDTTETSNLELCDTILKVFNLDHSEHNIA